MFNRHQCIALLGLGWTGAQADTGAPAQVPALSNAPLGAAIPAGWRHQTLPKVEHANDFEIVDDGGRHVLHVRSSSAASSWVAPLDIDPAQLPMLGWRWKVSRSLAQSDVRTKRGDDYAARLYVFFDPPAHELSLTERLRAKAAKLLYSADIPAAALCYVWGQAQAAGSTAWNPYTDHVRMIVVDSGNTHAMQWREVSRHVARDWTEAFGGPAPHVSGIGLGADTDNTGDTVEAWFDAPRFTPAP